MRGRIFNWGLLLATILLLSLGFIYPTAWFVAGLLGLIPATIWFFQDLRAHSMGSDVLAILSITGALLISENAAAAIISLMLASGRVLEGWAEGQAERQLKLLLSRMPRRVNRKSADGSIEDISVAEIAVGDVLLVRNGEITPTDGVLIDGATLDESALTGEPLPRTRKSGEDVSSGVVNASAPFFFTATATAQASTFAGIIKLVEEAQKKSAPGIRIANRWALIFLPVALSIAGLAWWITGDDHRAVAVLVVATPCPLILAVPIAIVAGLSRAAKSGAIIKGGAVLEQLGRVERVLLDKTGTLTHGGPAVSAIAAKPGLDVDQVLLLAASVDQFSPHIVAKALLLQARKRGFELLEVSDVREDPGHHISGNIAGKQITVGQLTSSLPQWLNFDLPLMVAVYSDEELIGLIGLEDPIRPEAPSMVAALRASGVAHISLVTGDRDDVAQSVARAVGITEVFSQVGPEEKLALTRSALEKSKGAVVVVGDGINDAPALAAADVGVAMGARGASAASEAADVVIVEDSIDRLTQAIRIASTSRRKALEAAGVGMALAVIGMFLGAFGVISPSQGAIAQEAIDVIAILWALSALRS